METTDYASYELSVKLKGCGFDEPCDSYYTNGYINDDPEDLNRVVKLHNDRVYNHNKVMGVDGEHISAVPLWHAQKWLREKKKMHCQVLLNGVRSMFFWQVRELVGNGKYADSTRQYYVYEDAMSDCISAALELIKE